jgi:hypothetical protein
MAAFELFRPDSVPVLDLDRPWGRLAVVSRLRELLVVEPDLAKQRRFQSCPDSSSSAMDQQEASSSSMSTGLPSSDRAAW